MSIMHAFKSMLTWGRPLCRRYSCPAQQIKSKVLDKLFLPAEDRQQSLMNKVTIVGIGHVGMAVALPLLIRNLTKNLCLIDNNEEKLVGATLDLQQGSSFTKSARIVGSTDVKHSACSQVIIITAGVRAKKGESRHTMAETNREIMLGILPELVRVSPEAIILMVNNPVDILSYVAWRVSGFPKNRVLGTGALLGTARFRNELSKPLNVSAGSCDGWIIGEHGDASVPVWSGSEVARARLGDLHPTLGTKKGQEESNEVHENVVKSAFNVSGRKGYTSWAIGLTAVAIVASILHNEGKILSVCTAAKGKYGIDKDIWLSLPCVVSSSGATAVVQQTLDEEEQEGLKKSADILADVQKKVKFRN